MSAVHTCFPAQRLVHVRFFGRVTVAQMQEDFARMQADPDFDPDFDALNDLRDADDFDVGFNDLHQLHSAVSQLYDGQRHRLRVALLLKGDAVLGYARQYQNIAEVYGVIECSIHFDEAEALAALGMPVSRIGDLLK